MLRRTQRSAVRGEWIRAWREMCERVGHLFHLRDKGFASISGRQALYNMLNKGILDAVNGRLVGYSVIAQRKNKELLI